MPWVCACCFGGNKIDVAMGKCPACARCTDCDGKKVLLSFKRDEMEPPADSESYGDFLNRLEDVLLPAYKQHFENEQRKRYLTRLHVVRAMVFSQAMLNYRTGVLGEKDISASRVRYAVALRSFGKLQVEPEAAPVIHIDDSGGFQAVVGHSSPWRRRSAGVAYSFLTVAGVNQDFARKTSDLIRDPPETPEGKIVKESFVLDRLHKLSGEKHKDGADFLKAAEPLLKGQFTFASDAEHKDAREAIICEAGLLMKMTNWENDEGWRGQAHGALARVEKVIDTYEDIFPFLVQFYFEDPTHVIKS